MSLRTFRFESGDRYEQVRLDYGEIRTQRWMPQTRDLGPGAGRRTCNKSETGETGRRDGFKIRCLRA